MTENSGRILPVFIEDEMQKSYLDYSMSMITSRALPDVRDGLKPVHRRVLFGMEDLGLRHNRATKKCANVVGNVMAKYRCGTRWSRDRVTSDRSTVTRPRRTGTPSVA
jgi:DNA gyrase subunit A